MPALVDTGSQITLIKEAAATRLGCEIKTKQRLPSLRGVTGSPIRILGTALVEIGIGLQGVSKQHVPVVPNHYMHTDLLLGCDILNLSSMLLDQSKKVMYWGHAPYVLRMVRKGKHELCHKVTRLPPPDRSLSPQNNLHLPITAKVPPYQTKFVPLPIPEQPNTTVIVYPQGKVSANTHPYVATVDENRTVPCPVFNNTKAPKKYQRGFLFGWYEKGEVSSPSVNSIQNDLLPKSDKSYAHGGRREK